MTIKVDIWLIKIASYVWILLSGGKAMLHREFNENTNTSRGRRGRDPMVVGFITTYAISTHHHWHFEFESRSGDVYSIQHYVIKLVRDLQQISGFLRLLRFPPAIKNVDIKFSAHDAFLEKPSSGTLKIEILESQII